MTTGTEIDREARALLQDKDTVHWAAADMIDWINAFQRDLVTHKPKAGTVTKSLDIAANVAKQSVPAATIQLLDVICNMGADGATPGRAITLTTIERLAASRPNWRRDTGPAVRHWMQDDRDASVFYVWPQVTAATKVEGRAVDHPTAIATLATTLTAGAEYRNAGVHFVLFKAYSQDAADTAHAELAGLHYGLYASILGIQVKGQKKASAGANSTVNPGHPAVDKNGA
jgi:hypothetical protein